MTVKIFVELDEETAKALARYAGKEHREPSGQIVFLVEQKLVKLGLLQKNKADNQNKEG